MNISVRNRRQNNYVCPIVKNPFADCYCFNLNSRNISPTIKFCGNNFKDCEIYKDNFVTQSHISAEQDAELKA